MTDVLHPRWLIVPDFLPLVGVSLRASSPVPGLRLNKVAANDTSLPIVSGSVKQLVPHFHLGGRRARGKAI
jgi:hypothetical protein